MQLRVQVRAALRTPHRRRHESRTALRALHSMHRELFASAFRRAAPAPLSSQPASRRQTLLLDDAKQYVCVLDGLPGGAFDQVVDRRYDNERWLFHVRSLGHTEADDVATHDVPQ